MGEFIRHYLLQAAEGKSSELRQALWDLADAVGAIEGCRTTLLLQDETAAHADDFFEVWVSGGAYAQGSKHLDKRVLKPVMAALSAAPTVRTLLVAARP